MIDKMIDKINIRIKVFQYVFRGSIACPAGWLRECHGCSVRPGRPTCGHIDRGQEHGQYPAGYKYMTLVYET